MKAIEQYFPVLLFIMLDEIHSIESYWNVLSRVMFTMLNKVGDNWIKSLLTLSSSCAKACWDISPLLAFAGESVSSSS